MRFVYSIEISLRMIFGSVLSKKTQQVSKFISILRWFLVGAFSFKEKSPTITVASFFFRQTTELIAYVPLFTETDKFTQAKFHQCKLTAKGPPFVFYLFYVTYKTGRLQRVPPFNFFSAQCEFFFSKIFNFSKESPLRIF